MDNPNDEETEVIDGEQSDGNGLDGFLLALVLIILLLVAPYLAVLLR